MKNLNFELKVLCERNCDGSFATRAARHNILQLSATQLEALGFLYLTAGGIKQKHVIALIEYWQKNGISIGTIKNRMAHLRWWAEKVGKPSIIPRSNSALGIGNRVFVTNIDMGIDLADVDLTRVTNEYTKVSLQLQEAFGLRREEAMKFVPAWADRGDKIVLKASWCKGGRQREIKIVSDQQREVLKLAHQIAGRGSLIPSGKKYIQQVKVFERECGKAGLHKSHGLRHRFAQRLYESLSGWQCPALGGPKSKALSPEQKSIDREVRLTISRALGHEREQVTAIYLGR